MVDIIRDFLAAHQMFVEIFTRFREGSLRFEAVRRLVGDDESSVLYRLKERCHTIFGPEVTEAGELEMRREAILDLTVGSLFHESMKLRENLYQQEIYLPRVEALQKQADAEAGELFGEFEKILAAVSMRLEEAVRETQALLDQTRKQLRLLMVHHRENGLIARCLYEREEQVLVAFPDGVDALLAEIYGDFTEGYMKAAHSYLESAYFTEALCVLHRVASISPERADAGRLVDYAQGMSAFLAGDYPSSVDRLADWLEAGPSAEEQGRVKLAFSAISGVKNLVDAEQNAELLAGAQDLADRLKLLLGS